MKNQATNRIGIFDSGFGGLNIMRAIVNKNPAYDFVYLGDTARVPYGTRLISRIILKNSEVNFFWHGN